MDALMGIDLGSTSIKAVIYDTKGAFISSGSTPTETANLDSSHPEWVFWDPDVIWNSVCRAVKEALNRSSRDVDIAAVSVTGWGMDGIPLDDGGAPLYPFISWHCSRTEPQRQRFADTIGLEKLFSITGTQTMVIHTAYRMMWLQENKPGILDKAAVWLPIEDYINYKLCGVWGTDYSMASCTALFDQKKRAWSEELISAAGIPGRIFPEVRDSGTQIGTVTQKAAGESGLGQGTPVVLGGHDYHCGGLAVGAFDPGVVMDITGTWEILFSASETANLGPSVYRSGLVLESHVAKNRYNYAAYALSAGMLEWFKDEFALQECMEAEESGESVWKELMTKASAVPPGSRGVFFLPHFSGAVTPNVDPKSLGAFIGLSEQAERSVCARAVIEGLDYQFRELLDSFEAALGQDIKKVITVGGTTRNEFWMQNKADVSGKIIEVPEIEEATPLGAAILAGIGAGIFRDEKDGFNKTYKPGKIYTPEPDLSGRYDKYYSLYQKIYPSLKDINHEITDTLRSDNS